jgi:hypothetical protein
LTGSLWAVALDAPTSATRVINKLQKMEILAFPLRIANLLCCLTVLKLLRSIIDLSTCDTTAMSPKAQPVDLFVKVMRDAATATGRKSEYDFVDARSS